jgi:hypothetical protein
MKSNMLAATVAAVMLLGSPVFAPSASAQPASAGGASNSYLVPMVVGAAAGATVGALLWPAVVVPAGAAMAAPAAAAGMGWGWGAFMTTRAVVGAIIGGGLGYLAAR